MDLGSIIAFAVLVLLMFIGRELRLLRKEYQRQRRTNFYGVSDEDISRCEAGVLAEWERFVSLPEGPEREKVKERHDRLIAALDRARQSRADVVSGRKTLSDVRAENEPKLQDFINWNRLR